MNEAAEFVSFCFSSTTFLLDSICILSAFNFLHLLYLVIFVSFLFSAGPRESKVYL